MISVPNAASQPSSTAWLAAAAEREQWPLDDLARVTDELLRLDIDIEQRDNGIGIVGSDDTEPLAAKHRQPVRMALYRLIRGEQARQQRRRRDEAWSRSRNVESSRLHTE